MDYKLQLMQDINRLEKERQRALKISCKYVAAARKRRIDEKLKEFNMLKHSEQNQ